MRKFLNTFWGDASGLTQIEYAMLLAFTAAIFVTALSDVGDALGTAFGHACAELGGTCLNAVEFVQSSVLNRRP